MTREMIMNELKNRGYSVTTTEVKKNGVVREGIIVSNNTPVSPIVYTDDYKLLPEEQLENTVSEIIRIVSEAKEGSQGLESIVAQGFYTRDYILKNAYIALEKAGCNKGVLKKDSGMDGIEKILYARVDLGREDGFGTVKLKEEMLPVADVTEEEVWKTAEENTNSETTIQNLASLLGGLAGSAFGEDSPAASMYVFSNTSGAKGASAILNKKAVSELGKKLGVNRFVVLPSSIHEMLLVPYAEDTDMDAMSAMVADVNAEQVRPEERLTDHAYVMDAVSGAIL